MDGELKHGLTPGGLTTTPGFLGVADGHKDELEGSIVVGQGAFSLEDFSKMSIESLDGIRGIDGPADFFGEGQEGTDFGPAGAPGGSDHGEAPSPFGVESIERLLCIGDGGSDIYFSEVGTNRLSIFPGH